MSVSIVHHTLTASFFISIIRTHNELVTLISLCGLGDAKVPVVATDHISCDIIHQVRKRTKWVPEADTLNGCLQYGNLVSMTSSPVTSSRVSHIGTLYMVIWIAHFSINIDI